MAGQDSALSTASLVPRSDLPTVLRIEERHSLAVRWMHWINFPLLAIMIWSGLMIYWADSIDLNILEHRVYRVGVGNFTLFRFFPDWFYNAFRLNNHFTRGLSFHALVMWPFAINGIAYLLFLAISGEWRRIVPGARDFRQLARTVWNDLLNREAAGHGETYNGAQRIAYTLVLMIGAISVISGIAIWKPTSLPFTTAMMGGYRAARLIHFWTTIAFCIFICVHLFQGLRAGWGRLQSIVTGFDIVAEPEANKPSLEAESVHGD
ncbi:MAG: cytochrome b/b6 domain-containing protein [Acidobacteria bacterium]|nr:cytochrome b/b6 domain-containing protein [Acidobacteriota bacterium]